MSRIRQLLGRRRWSFVLATVIILVSAGVAFAILVSAVLSQWSSASPSDSARCLAYDSGYIDLSRVKWGRPENYGSCPALMNTSKSGYTFDGVTPGDVAANTNFLLGQFTHHNNPIYAGTSITQVDLAMQMDVCASGNTKTFSGYTFYHDETTNWPDCGTTCDCNASYPYDDYDYCEYGPGDLDWPGGSRCPGWPGDTGPNRNGCADRVTLPYDIPSTTFDCEGNTLTLFLSGFIPTSGTCPATPTGSAARYFYTVEETDNAACVYGRVTVPSAISLAALTATAQGDAVVITWDTVSEIDNAGFNLYRDTSAGGLGVKLNESLIPSKAPNSSEGFSYSFSDSAGLVPGTTYYYRLEDVSFSGSATIHDPVSVTTGAAPNAVGLASFNAASSLPAALPFAGLILTALGAAAVSRKRK